MLLRSHVARGGEVVCPPLLIESTGIDKENSNALALLHQAVVKDDVSAAETLLADSSLLFFYWDYLAEPLLHIAAHYGSVGVMKVLIEKCIDVNRANASGSTALHEAAIQNQLGAVEFLLAEAGAFVSPRDSRGRTPLHAAYNAGAVAMIRLFVHHGADVGKAINKAFPPVHLAAEEGDASAIDKLCNAGADFDLRVKRKLYCDSFKLPDDWSALDLAACFGHIDAVRALVRHGADVNAVSSEGYTALFRAACEDEAEVIDALVAAGANARRSGEHSIPIIGASRANAPEAIRALVRHGIDPNALFHGSGTALTEAAEEGCIDAIEALVAAGAELDLPYLDWTPLMKAAACFQSEAVKKLVQLGAEVDFVNEDSETALLVSVMTSQSLDVIDALVGAGADVNSQKGYLTPLQMACECESNTVMAALLRHGADPNLPDSHGNTPLHLTARHMRYKEILGGVDLLLRAGADETAVNNEDLTPAILLQLRNDGCVGANWCIESALDLLEYAPADRAWRRRGLLLLCRAYPHKPPLQPTGVQPKGGRTKMPREDAGRIAAGNTLAGKGAAWGQVTARNPVNVVAWLVGVAEDGIFRNVVIFM